MAVDFGIRVGSTLSCIQITNISDLCTQGFDRDLSVAGRVMVKTEDGSIVQKLAKIDRQSKCRISPDLRNTR